MKIIGVALIGFAVTAISAIVAADSIPNLQPFANGSGYSETYNANSQGPFRLDGAFFQSLGTNGRSCSTCHTPSTSWTVSAAEIQQRFLKTQGLDPIFRTNDGSVCDHNIDTSTVEGRRQAYSLLLSRGLLRITLPVPADAEFFVQSVSNPYGCNDASNLAVYRRPLPATNLRFLSTVMWDGRESTPPDTQKITYPDTGQLIADLKHQAMDATMGHAQGSAPSDAQLQAIVDFELGLYTAQALETKAGPLNRSGASGGPETLAVQPFFIGVNDSFPASFGLNPTGAPFNPKIFNLYDGWNNSWGQQASIARGQALFNSKPITIFGVAGINDVAGMPASFSGTCGTCHDTPNVGNHSVSTPLNIGVADVNNPLDHSYLPVFTLVNKVTNAIVQTTDPGRALITGKWVDIGKLKGPVLRGLASRAPYFHNGSAQTLNDVLKFYEQRFGLSLSAEEESDLIAFLNAL